MLKDILGGWLKKTSTNDEQARLSNLPKHEQTRLMLEKIAARKGRSFNPIKAASIELSVIDTNILSFIERIDLYSTKLELSESLTPQDCFSEIKVVTLDEFFTDSEEKYIPLETLNDFIKSCQRLFAAIDRGLAHKNRDLEYSLRLMSKCFSSIQSFCKAVEAAG